MNNDILAKFVLPNGTLNQEHLLKREFIYEGRNHKVIERFQVASPSGVQSYIFKPLTNEAVIGREKWVYQDLLSNTNIPYPKLLASSEHLIPQSYWMIFEDLGQLNHELSEPDYISVAKLIPSWHALSLDKIPVDFRGDKPYIDEIIAFVNDNWHSISSVLSSLKMGPLQINKLFDQIHSANALFNDDFVVSHGDLHAGNIGMTKDRLVILDWEFIQRNSIYWDLYTLLDMTHPLIRKKMNNTIRNQVLSTYITERNTKGTSSLNPSFTMKYFIFSAIYSLWMLLLIEKDLKEGKWAKSDLQASQIEIVGILHDCLDYL
ncbi:MAG: protein licA [Bacilli bacterium]|nr:protein licA [Bacilli bacterium]